MSKNKTRKPKLEISQKHNRTFSVEFKRRKVKDLLAKRISIKQFCEIYQVSRAAVYKWLYKYSDLEPGTKQVIEMESEALKTKQLHDQVAELERIIGRKQLEIDYLNTTLDLASDEVGYDLKKKYEPKPLNHSAIAKVKPAIK